MRWLVLIAAVLIAFAIAIVALGAVLPAKHVTSLQRSFHEPPQAVWQVLTDHAEDPKWRSQLTSIEKLPDHDGHPVWQENYKNGTKLTLEDIESTPPTRLVRQVQDAGNIFRGSWQFDLTADKDGGSTLKITEDAEIPNPFFRFMSRFVFGQTKSMKQFLNALARKFGERTDLRNN